MGLRVNPEGRCLDRVWGLNDDMLYDD
jgi:hypothetical protein